MIIETINKPQDLRLIEQKHLGTLANEIREEIIQVTSKNGGHLAPSLGVVELTVALHYVFNTPSDKIVWDVGHQAYAHKLITGRREDFKRLRQLGGISGFPNRDESDFDAFTVGHSSTSISSALGLLCANDHTGSDNNVVAVIGDGSLTGGMAYEGLNNAGHLKKDLLVVLNDNEMFISKKVGAMGEYLTRILTTEPVQKIEEKVKNILEKHPNWGTELIKIARRSKVMLTPGMLFEEMGFEYFGPVDGHDLNGLIDHFSKIKNIKGPRLLHVLTKKGKGYAPAETNPEKFHGTNPFHIKTGEPIKSTGFKVNYQDAFGETLVKLAQSNSKVIAITAAMESGTGLKKFHESFPDRFYDVGIAEQHAVTFAAGLAAEGLRPVCAIYSTFLQRSFDQIIHDVALPKLPVVFAIDRAGIVGEDGPTHHGVFDLSYLSMVPNMIVAAPSNEKQLRDMLYSAVNKWDSPAAIRYPRGKVLGLDIPDKYEEIEIGKAELITEGDDITIFAAGIMVNEAKKAVEELEKDGINAALVDLRFAKPLDVDLITEQSAKTKNVLTVEENSLIGGIGERIKMMIPDNINFDSLGIPDSFITYGKQEILRQKLKLDSEGIITSVRKLLRIKDPAK